MRLNIASYLAPLQARQPLPSRLFGVRQHLFGLLCKWSFQKQNEIEISAVLEKGIHFRRIKTKFSKHDDKIESKFRIFIFLQ
jgi:hypothetical protein